MDAVKVLQVVGFKNSGKTELMSRLLDIAKAKGKTVSTIKHHGHGGIPEMPPGTNDSTRFFNEGAASSLVYGGGVIQLHQREERVGLNDLLQMASMTVPDLVLVEGYKEADYDKIVLIRSAEDWEELQQLKRVVLVVVLEDLRLVGVKTAGRNNEEAIKKWFLEWMEGEKDESI